MNVIVRTPIAKLAPPVLGAALAAALGAGCGPAPSTEAVDSGLLYSCATETRAVPYAPNLERDSMSGAFKAVLVDSVPGPPIKGSNVWTVKITDAAGAPQDGLTVTASPYMPDHRHPTTVKAVVTPANDGTGTYKLDPVYLFMPGFWEVTLTLLPATGPKDTVVFPICIAG
jgi:YtkA-like